ncbi:glycosyltransferase family 2 protein [Atractiella rhizophila]|nr:glycosyltransferase family 2 protein [Atractiella rhizophila]
MSIPLSNNSSTTLVNRPHFLNEPPPEPVGRRRPPGAASNNSGAGVDRSKTFIGVQNNPYQRKLTRGKTLTRPERHVTPAPLINPTQALGQQQMPVPISKMKGDDDGWFKPWTFFSYCCTWWAPPFLLDWIGGMKDLPTQRAWREKVALCTIALLLGGIVGFVTIGLSAVLCPNSSNHGPAEYVRLGSLPGLVGINGWLFNTTGSKPVAGVDFAKLANQESGLDITALFDRTKVTYPSCAGNTARYATANLCANSSTSQFASCAAGDLSFSNLAALGLQNVTKEPGYDWDGVANETDFLVLDGNVLNLAPYMAAVPQAIPNDPVDTAIRFVLRTMDPSSGKDATRLFVSSNELKPAMDCLSDKYYAGHIDKITPGCFVSQLFLYLSLFVILSIVLARFAMACVFNWFLSETLVKPPRNLKRNVISPAVMPEGANIDVGNKNGAAPWVGPKAQKHNKLVKGGKEGSVQALDQNGLISMASIGAELFCVALVTCYSEGEEGIGNTLSSIAASDYSDARKLIFVVCDGLITGSGEKMSTPDIVVNMIEVDSRFRDPQPMSYGAVGAGKKAHNMAKVYAGHYTRVKGHRTPIVVIVKCGPPEEAHEAKPGNRGKRDSQMVLMNFFSRVTYNDRMTPLDYDLFRKTNALMGVTPDFFEVCLMVDADTKVYRDSIKHLVNCCQHDSTIMGVCGETRIANKRQSWVTAIQVFEYFISHHLAKGFESVFGGVTCLPGCFSMYRLKARKNNDGDWIPVLVQPQICLEYSQSVVSTLHQKNLLLLGEDRFLTTLMIRTFPNRKMMFCPQAKCRTIAPDEFKVLLSQRRRWINSTIHNLMELVRVPNLCGTFCFSMQFVVFMELIGTVVLPVAISLTYTLIVNYILNPPNNFADAIPLLLLGAVLGLPAVLILLTTRKIVYILWMFIYLLALPVWNFILPVYSFWHFDDFSWGETRKVAGEGKDKGHGDDSGTVSSDTVPLRRWEDWERTRLRKEKRKREAEKAFGTKHFHAGVNSEIFEGSQYGGSDTTSMFSGDEDRWGFQMPIYDQTGDHPPPVGLYSADNYSQYSRDSDMVKADQMELMMDSGWDDEHENPRQGHRGGHPNSQGAYSDYNRDPSSMSYPPSPSPNQYPPQAYFGPNGNNASYSSAHDRGAPSHAKKRSIPNQDRY